MATRPLLRSSYFSGRPHAAIGFVAARLPPGGTPALFLASGLLCVFVEQAWLLRHRRRSSPGSSNICPPRYRVLTVARWLSAAPLAILGTYGSTKALLEMTDSTTGVLHSKPTTQLLTGMSFGTCRHPLYSALLELYLAVALAHDSRALLIAMLATAAYLYAVVVPAEERFLEEQFGPEKWKDFVGATPAAWCILPPGLVGGSGEA